MAPRSQTEFTREVGPLSFRAEIVPSSINEKERTVDIVWTTGARVFRPAGWFNDAYYEELSLEPGHVRMDRLKSGRAPFLDSHDSSSTDAVVGVVRTARIDGSRGTAKVQFAEGDERAERLWNKVRQGILPNVSVGYRTYRAEKVEDGEEAVPTYRAVDWEPHEISSVPIGADAGAVVRSGEANGLHGCVFTRAAARLARDAMAKREDADTGDDDKVKAGERADDDDSEEMKRKKRGKREDEDDEERAEGEDEDEETEGDDGEGDEDDKKSSRALAVVQLEAVRADKIRKIVRKAKLPSKLAEDLIEGGHSVRAVRQAVLRTLGESDRKLPGTQASGVSLVTDSRDKLLRGASAWLFHRSGTANVVAEAKRRAEAGALRGLDFRTLEMLKEPVSFDGGGEFRGASMLEMAALLVGRDGRRRFERMTKQEQAQSIMAHASQRAELAARDGVGPSGYFGRDGGLDSTSDFPLLLENVLHKVLLAQYAITPDTWTNFCRVGSVVDFRPHPRYRLGSFGALKSLNEQGEFEDQNIPDAEKQTISAKTKGVMIGISRQALINDDLSAFSMLATQLGRQTKLTIEIDVYATLALNAGLGPLLYDGVALFDATHNNVTTGAALGVAALDADRVAMKSQKDPSGNELLDLVPYVLLVPVGLGGYARVINQAQYDTDPVTTNATNKFQQPNRVLGLFNTIVDTARLTGTRRYLFADPAIAPVLEVVFLEGQQAPYLEWRLGWRLDGLEWKVRMDYGVGGVDFRGAITNAGA